MKITISQRKRADIMPDMMGLFFEDINYAADGGLYAEMLENRAFEFVDCYGDKADYYTEFDGLYGWECYPKEKNARAVCHGKPGCGRKSALFKIYGGGIAGGF